MDPARLRKLLTGVRRGRVSTREALEAIAHLPFESIGSATVDHHRGIRQALPEVIYCEGKSRAQCVAIARAIHARSGRLLATRATTEQARALCEEFGTSATWNEPARTVAVKDAVRRTRAARSARGNGARPRAGGRKKGTMVAAAGRRPGRVLVVSGGTSDLPVAEEAAVTLEFMGVPVGRVYDAGVAGIHRILRHVPALRKASAVVVVAGMEGALASVVGGITGCPVIAVPTSVGYGASFGGLAALLAMLNSCAAGVTVVNIDNGFGAGYAAGVIALRSRSGSRA